MNVEEELFDRDKERFQEAMPVFSRIGSKDIDFEWPPWIQSAIREINLFYKTEAIGIDDKNGDEVWSMITSISNILFICTNKGLQMFDKRDITDIFSFYHMFRHETHTYAFSLNAFFWKAGTPGIVPTITYCIWDLKRREIVAFLITPLFANKLIKPSEVPRVLLYKIWRNLTCDPTRSYVLLPSEVGPKSAECFQTYYLLIYPLRSNKINALISAPLSHVADFFVFGYSTDERKARLSTDFTGSSKGNKFKMSLTLNIGKSVYNFRADNKHRPQTEIHYDIERYGQDGRIKSLKFALLDAAEFDEIGLLEHSFPILLLVNADITKLNMIGLEKTVERYGEILEFRRWQIKQLASALRSRSASRLRSIQTSDSFLVGFPHGRGRCQFENYRARKIRELMKEYNLVLNQVLSTSKRKSKRQIYYEIIRRESDLGKKMDAEGTKTEYVSVLKMNNIIEEHLALDLEWAKSLLSDKI